MQDPQGEAQGQTRPDDPAPKRRRWPAWATGLCVLLGGLLIGAACFELFIAPHWGEPGKFRVHGGVDPNAPEEARVAVTTSRVLAAPGDWISVTWLVMNTGQSTWAVDLYRFAPDEAALPVLPLPRAVAPGEEVEVRAVLRVPSDSRLWEPVWRLKGRRGPVPGGSLRLQVIASEPL